MTTSPVTGFKAATHELKCRDHQFEVGQTYTIDGDPIQCERGFHFCANPLDVWNYYPLIQDDGKLTRYMTVEAVGAVKHDGDKSVTASIAIRAELTLPAFIKSAVDGIISLCKPAYGVTVASGYDSQLAASGNYSQLAASGHGSQLAASGSYSQLAASGNYSKLAASGNYSKLAASGSYSQLAASGNYSKLAASGYDSQLAASGNYSQLAASGNDSKLAASGNYSKLAIEGTNGVAMSAGNRSTVTGIDGTWVSLASYDDQGKCNGIATGCIGKGKLKAGRVYRAEAGKFVEVQS